MRDSQTIKLKVVTLSDSSFITEDLKSFDSVFYHCLTNYGKQECAHSFLYPQRNAKHPVTCFNFIDGIDVSLNMVFEFKMVSETVVRDSLKSYLLDLGWMQFSMLYHPKYKKLVQFTDVNYWDLKHFSFKNLDIYTEATQLDTQSCKQTMDKIYFALNDIGIEKDSFNHKNYVIYSAKNLRDAERYIGGLYPQNYFNLNSIYGGMADPFQSVVLSGVNSTLHTHELLHLAIPLKVNKFIGEGLATYYGGTGNYQYQELVPYVIKKLQEYHIQSFEELFLAKMDQEFVAKRGGYVVAAYLLNKVKSDFGLTVYREFLRSSDTQFHMIEFLKNQYNIQSEQLLFKTIYSL